MHKAVLRADGARRAALSFRAFTSCALLFCGASLHAQVHRAGAQVVTFRSDVDGSDQPYALYLPPKYDNSRQYPLVMSLHGAGTNHVLNLNQVFGVRPRFGEMRARMLRGQTLPEVDFIVASPLARGTMGYQGIAEKDVYDVLEDVRNRFSIDEDRIYLTGVSMGGGGALWLGLTRPDVWAAVAAVCPAVAPGTEKLAGNAFNLPVHLFHGEADKAVPVTVSRSWQKRFLELVVPVEYIEYPGAGHNVWDLAYKDQAIFTLFARHKRDRFPARVRFQTDSYKYNSAYWVELNGLTPGTMASIDAGFTGTGRIQIRTNRLDGFTLNLKGHPSAPESSVLQVEIDGSTHKLKPGGAVSFSKRSGKWVQERYVPRPGDKRPGLEGPIHHALASRHIYVYGTELPTNGDNEDSRRKLAAEAAQWSTPRAKLMVSFRVLADRDVSDADIAGTNLVLFGNSRTNRLIARMAPQLPIELNPGAADYGLIFVAPAGNRYVVVNSGLPWWQGMERAPEENFGVLVSPPALSALGGRGDFVLFKGSLENVVAEGRFDRNWKVPPEAAEKMLATGAVRIR